MDTTSGVSIKFGRGVCKRRKKKRWSQEKLAEESEIHRTYITKIEKGRVPHLSLAYASKLARALGSTIDVILKDGEEE